MIHYFGLILIISFSLLIIRNLIIVASGRISGNSFSSFKRKAITRKRFMEKVRDQESSRLIISPKSNIQILDSDKGIDLREKADIHKARLKKHGKSRLNGKLYFIGPKGGIFTLNNSGEKRYV